MNPDTLKEANALTREIDRVERNIVSIDKAIGYKVNLSIDYEYDRYDKGNYISVSKEESIEILQMLRKNNMNRLERLKKTLEEM